MLVVAVGWAAVVIAASFVCCCCKNFARITIESIYSITLLCTTVIKFTWGPQLLLCDPVIFSESPLCVRISFADAPFPAFRRADSALIIILWAQFSSKYEGLTSDISFLMKYWVRPDMTGEIKFWHVWPRDWERKIPWLQKYSMIPSRVPYENDLIPHSWIS